MKKLIITVMLAAALVGCDRQQSQIESERQQRLAAERQAAEKEASRNSWEVISFLLCFGSIILFAVGVSLGSVARKNAKPRD